MDTAGILEILKREYGIGSKEEFETSVSEYAGIDIGIFLTPIKNAKGDVESA